MKRQRLIVCTIVILLSQLLFLKPAYSKISETSKIDAVLVMDASGSMEESDPRKISFEAANMFVDMCSVEGDRIGIAAYTDRVVQQAPLREIKSADDKRLLKELVSGIPKKGATDISVGLKAAVQILDSGRDQSHKPLIILLSDGKTELAGSSRTIEQSSTDMKDALEIASYKGYPIYTIGLNADGSVDQDELRDIASSTKAKSFITDTADNLPQILSEIFADHLKLKIVSPGYINGTGNYEDVKITIPDNNVVEANISLLSQNPVEVKLIDGSGQERQVPSENIYYSVSNSYSMIKLLNPEKGDWTLKVKGISGDRIKVNLIFNYDLKLIMAIDPKDNLYRGQAINVSAYLESNGQRLQDKESYDGMKASLLVKDLDSQKEEKNDIPVNGDGFSGSIKLGEGKSYEIKAIVESESFVRESEAVVISISNRPPVVYQGIKDIKLLSGKSKTLDLTNVFTDPDGDALSISAWLSQAGIADANVNGSTLNISSKSRGKTGITITADDGKGGKVETTFELQVTSIIPYIIAGAAAILLLVLLIFVLLLIRNGNKPFVGQVMVEIRDLAANKMTPPQYRRLDTYKGKVTLYQLLQLLPEYKEGEKIVFTPGRNDTLVLKNMTESTVERTGRVVDASKGYELKFNDRITINLSTIQKSISIEYFK